MAAHETRMLLLGAVAMFEPVNGYQIRRELLSWQVDRWAHVNPGSIYHGLGRLADQELLCRHDLVDGSREVAVYELTDSGREELERLLIGGLESVDPVDRSGFTIALSMLPLLTRRQVIGSLTKRRTGLEASVRELGPGSDDEDYTPPHARRARLLWLDLAIAELAWLREALADIKAGRLRFELGEDWGWQPPADDEGWQMNLDRDRYRTLLGR